MARIVPSLVARAIEFTYHGAAEDVMKGTSNFGSLEQDQSPHVGMIVSLAERIPEELLPTDAKDLTLFFAACGAMRGALTSWSGGGHPNYNAKLSASALFGGKNPVVALLRILRTCPDERATTETQGLEFIADQEARDDIRIDISNAHRALGNGEYKAATVLAGAVIEALLLWAIKQRKEPEISAALEIVAGAAKQSGRRPPHKSGPEYWHLPDFIAIAQELGILDATSVTAAGLAGEFRNLIHPGRVLRIGSRCDQSTALTTIGAMERIVEQLGKPL